MDKLLTTIYNCFYTPKTDERLSQVIKNTHRDLIERLPNEDRKRVLQIIDAQDALADLQAMDSFIQGFRLAAQLAVELGYIGSSNQDVSH